MKRDKNTATIKSLRAALHERDEKIAQQAETLKDLREVLQRSSERETNAVNMCANLRTKIMTLEADLDVACAKEQEAPVASVVPTEGRPCD